MPTWEGGVLRGLRLCGRRVALAALATGFACAPAAVLTATPPAPHATKEPTREYILPADSWIEVDLEGQQVLLHEGSDTIAAYPASSGVKDHETPPGLYRVQMMEKGPIENVPGVWVSDILIFHWGMGIGIHSMPMDAEGNVLDPALGQPSTGGCVRVGDSARVFDFAEIGMHVWIH